MLTPKQTNFLRFAIDCNFSGKSAKRFCSDVGYLQRAYHASPTGYAIAQKLLVVADLWPHCDERDAAIDILERELNWQRLGLEAAGQRQSTEK